MHKRIEASGYGYGKTREFLIVFFFSLLRRDPVDKLGPYTFYVPTLIWGNVYPFYQYTC